MKPRKLRRLRVTEISTVDHGAGENVRIVLHKRADPGAPVRFSKDGRSWTVPATSPILGDLFENADRLGLEIEGAMKSAPVEKAVVNNGFMEIDMDITKRIAEIRKTSPLIGDDQAIARIATSSRPADQALWKAYKEGATVPPPAAAPAPIAKSAPLLKLEKKARKLQKRDPTLSEAQAFAKVYSDPQYAELVAEEKSAFFNKVGPAPRRSAAGDAFETLIRTLMAMHPGMDLSEARRWAKLTQQHRPPDVQRLVDYPL